MWGPMRNLLTDISAPRELASLVPSYFFRSTPSVVSTTRPLPPLLPIETDAGARVAPIAGGAPSSLQRRPADELWWHSSSISVAPRSLLSSLWRSSSSRRLRCAHRSAPGGAPPRLWPSRRACCPRLWKSEHCYVTVVRTPESRASKLYT
ncbi:unnamed protein product [Urochloa humidicola]